MKNLILIILFFLYAVSGMCENVVHVRVIPSHPAEILIDNSFGNLNIKTSHGAYLMPSSKPDDLISLGESPIDLYVEIGENDHKTFIMPGLTADFGDGTVIRTRPFEVNSSEIKEMEIEIHKSSKEISYSEPTSVSSVNDLVEDTNLAESDSIKDADKLDTRFTKAIYFSNLSICLEDCEGKSTYDSYLRWGLNLGVEINSFLRLEGGYTSFNIESSRSEGLNTAKIKTNISGLEISGAFLINPQYLGFGIFSGKAKFSGVYETQSFGTLKLEAEGDAFGWRFFAGRTFWRDTLFIEVSLYSMKISPKGKYVDDNYNIEIVNLSTSFGFRF